jgi:hypothetical protein
LAYAAEDPHEHVDCRDESQGIRCAGNRWDFHRSGQNGSACSLLSGRITGCDETATCDVRPFLVSAGADRAKGKIDEKKLRSWKLLDVFRRRLAKIHAEMSPPPEKRPGGPERLLLEEDYFSLMLFGMLNPVLDTMRGLCAAMRGSTSDKTTLGGSLPRRCKESAMRRKKLKAYWARPKDSKKAKNSPATNCCAPSFTSSTDASKPTSSSASSPAACTSPLSNTTRRRPPA